MARRQPAATLLDRRIRRVRIDRALSWCAVGIVAAAVAVLILFSAVLGVGTVQGSSMAPELRDGDKVLYLRAPLAYEEGDVALVNVQRLARFVPESEARELGSGGDLVKRVTKAPSGAFEQNGRYWIEGIDEAVPQEAFDGKVLLVVRVLKGAGDA